MPGVDANIAIHRLHVDPTHRPAKQKRNFSEEKNQAIREETSSTLTKIAPKTTSHCLAWEYWWMGVPVMKSSTF
ncbi:hypothetical protein LIER_36795 [Lithospermum erythrorhizon]|uniref:Uncharacterized protein n=1 Tax=Lithospermum erythrorhizon TaxID=34254 RepID=A0AAV3PF44_LITER